MEPFQVLGKYEPLGYMPDPRLLTHPKFEVRTPRQNVPPPDDRGTTTQWHRDATPSQVRALIVWSNSYPTEVLLPDGTIASGEPFDVVLFSNADCKHRVSPEYVQVCNRTDSLRKPNRWFMRAQLLVVPNLQRIEQWQHTLKNYQVEGSEHPEL